MITSHVESIARVRHELAELFPSHYEALSVHKEHGFPVEPLWNEWIYGEEQGKLALITLRESGKLIAYWIEWIRPSAHYASCLSAVMDMFWIAPGYKTGPNALRLIRAVKSENLRRGIHLWSAGEKIHAPVGRLFKAVGMAPFETTWAVWLKDKN